MTCGSSIMLRLDKKDLKILKAFWEDEIIASEVYKSLAKKAKPQRKELFLKLAEMERSHAELWQSIAKKYFQARFKITLGLRIKIFFHKVLAKLMPLTFILNYLERNEREATIAYSEFLEKFKDVPEMYQSIQKVVYDEIEHELTFIEMLVGEESYLATIKDAIYGMTDSLVEILALVIGLAGIIANPLTVGLAGLISTLGGTFSMTTGAYLSTRSQNDIYEGKIRELNARKSIAKDTLESELIRVLSERGIREDVARGLVESLRDNPEALSNLVEKLTIEETPRNPWEVAKTTGFYYVLGALPAILPFFIGGFLGASTPIIAMVAITIASITTFIAGILTAVLSGVGVLRKAIMNVFMVIGAALATFGLATIARIFIGIEA